MTLTQNGDFLKRPRNAAQRKGTGFNLQNRKRTERREDHIKHLYKEIKATTDRRIKVGCIYPKKATPSSSADPKSYVLQLEYKLLYKCIIWRAENLKV